mmetsp:Transcript_30044/g.35703  ORF Transcript_30044/g.35703 Transcript_30044/m.35703 type:complete len:119 (-) Transcript_30044:329-685(-)
MHEHSATNTLSIRPRPRTSSTPSSLTSTRTKRSLLLHRTHHTVLKGTNETIDRTNTSTSERNEHESSSLNIFSLRLPTNDPPYGRFRTKILLIFSLVHQQNRGITRPHETTTHPSTIY